MTTRALLDGVLASVGRTAVPTDEVELRRSDPILDTPFRVYPGFPKTTG